MDLFLTGLLKALAWVSVAVLTCFLVYFYFPVLERIPFAKNSHSAGKRLLVISLALFMGSVFAAPVYLLIVWFDTWGVTLLRL